MSAENPNPDDIVDEETDDADQDDFDEDTDAEFTPFERERLAQLFKGLIIDHDREGENQAIMEYITQIKQIQRNIDSPKVFFYKKSLIIDYDHLIFLDKRPEDAPPDFDSDVATKVLDDPDTTIPALREIFEEVLDEEYGGGFAEANGPFFIRIKNVSKKIRGFEDLRPEEKTDRMVEIRGTVIQTSTIKSKLRSVFFRCMRCGETTEVVQDIDGQYIAPDPCQSSECRGRTSVKQWRRISRRCRRTAFQHIIIQEGHGFSDSMRDATPLHVFLTGDIVKIALPGNTVRITGILRATPAKWKLYEDSFNIPIEDKTFWASYVDVKRSDVAEERMFTDEDLLDLVTYVHDGQRYYGDERDATLKFYKTVLYQNEILPKIEQKQMEWEAIQRSLIGQGLEGGVELETIREGVRLMLYGGVDIYNSNESSPYRSNFHILIIGDPSVGKSRIGRDIPILVKISQYASADTTSRVGLTAAVVKDELGGKESLSLRGGVIPYANNGVAVLDEIQNFDKEELDALREPMELQRISVNKGGFNDTLDARTAIIALANPAFGRYDVDKDITENVKIDPAILSRFDLVYVLMDIDRRRIGTEEERMEKQEKRDRMICRGILRRGSKQRQVDPMLDINRRKMYEFIEFAKKYCESRRDPRDLTKMPIDFPEELDDMIEDKYIQLRHFSYGDLFKGIQATTRQLEGLQRIASASAKSNLRLHVNARDVQISINQMDQTLINTSRVGEEPDQSIFYSKDKKGVTHESYVQLRLNLLFDLSNKNTSAADVGIYAAEMVKRGEFKSKKDADKFIAEMLNEGIFQEDGDGVLLSPNGLKKIGKKIQPKFDKVIQGSSTSNVDEIFEALKKSKKTKPKDIDIPEF